MTEIELEKEVLDLIPKICILEDSRESALQIMDRALKRHKISLKNLTTLYESGLIISKKVAKANMVGVVYDITINHNRFNKSEYSVFWELKGITKSDMQYERTIDDITSGIKETGIHDIDMPECRYTTELVTLLVNNRDSNKVHLNNLSFKCYNIYELSNILFSLSTVCAMDNNITDTLDLSIDHMIEDLITRIKTDSSDKIKEDTEFSVRAFYNLMCNLIQIKINLEIENFCKTNSDLSALEHKFNITQEIAAVVFTQHFENYKNFISNPHERTEICLLREGAVQILNTIYNKPICESLKIESNPEGYKDVITSNDNTITVFADAKKVVVKTRKIDTFPTDLLTFSHDKGIFPSDEETLEYL